MGAAHDCREKALIHKHFVDANIWSIGTNPAQQEHHTQKHNFTDNNIGNVGTHELKQRAPYSQKAD